ncbi:hypothetical protein [Ectothiorhodospira mobilis]|uniref:hypothetical protein n=1 Tax=Ectothiorhodospira mobilis TaxID=195064 RepID=UPI001908CF71|nr:hypothetical protein [Ectothiorhodospira mobilis]MBK1691945.1 hypothetical protein [Ectothiorhodospira mobilis]
MPARTRIILLSVIALATIVFLQPFLTFIGGLVVLAVAGTFIYRDLPQDTQDMIEDYLGNWLQKARDGFWPGGGDRDPEPEPEPAPAPKAAAPRETSQEKAPAKPRTRRSRSPRSRTNGGNGGGTGKGSGAKED